MFSISSRNRTRGRHILSRIDIRSLRNSLSNINRIGNGNIRIKRLDICMRIRIRSRLRARIRIR